MSMEKYISAELSEQSEEDEHAGVGALQEESGEEESSSGEEETSGEEDSSSGEEESDTSSEEQFLMTEASPPRTPEEEPQPQQQGAPTPQRRGAGRRRRRGAIHRNVQWLADAKKAWPVLHLPEIEALWDLFEKYADPISKEITKDGVSQILDESLRQLFDKIDVDHSGVLEREEIHGLVHALGRPKHTPQQLDRVMEALDQDGDGEVTYEEFKEWWDREQFRNEAERLMELTDLFEQVDTDGSGEVSWDEFLAMNGSHISRIAEYRDPDRETEEAATIMWAAIESVKTDIRAIYGTNMQHKTEVAMRHQAEFDALSRRCFFFPDGWFRLYWDITQAILLFYVACTVPVRIGFGLEAQPGDFLFWVEVGVYLYFVTDIFINFRSAYQTRERGNETVLHVDLKEIRNRYLKGWFVIDVLSCLPTNYVELFIQLSQGTEDAVATAQQQGVRVLRLLRLAKLLRLARIQRLINRLDMDYKGFASAMKTWKLILGILFIAHFVASIWYMLGTEEAEGFAKPIGFTTLESHPDEDVGTPLYETFGVADSLENPELILNDGWATKNGWGLLEPVIESQASLFVMYLDAVYYSVTTLSTVGYGDRLPFTNAEKLFSILAEMAGSIIFGIVCGSLSSIAMSVTPSTHEKNNLRQALDGFLTMKMISPELKKSIIQQQEHWMETRSVFDEQEILGRLPPKVRKTLLREMYKTHLETCPILKGVEDPILDKLCMQMMPYLAMEDDEIVVENEIGDCMYMIVTGMVKIHSFQMPKYNARQFLHDGAFFGELPMLGLGGGPHQNVHVYSATAASVSDLVVISNHSLTYIQQLFPSFHDKVHSLAKKRADRFVSLEGSAASTPTVGKLPSVTSRTHKLSLRGSAVVRSNPSSPTSETSASSPGGSPGAVVPGNAMRRHGGMEGEVAHLRRDVEALKDAVGSLEAAMQQRAQSREPSIL